MEEEDDDSPDPTPANKSDGNSGESPIPAKLLRAERCWGFASGGAPDEARPLTGPAAGASWGCGPGLLRFFPRDFGAGPSGASEAPLNPLLPLLVACPETD